MSSRVVFHRLGLLAFAVVTASAMLAGCEQSEGSRCQVDPDCASGLVCNQATSTCQTTRGGGSGEIVPDARVALPPDAETVDAQTFDAQTFDADTGAMFDGE